MPTLNGSTFATPAGPIAPDVAPCLREPYSLASVRDAPLPHEAAKKPAAAVGASRHGRGGVPRPRWPPAASHAYTRARAAQRKTALPPRAHGAGGGRGNAPARAATMLSRAR